MQNMKTNKERHPEMVIAFRKAIYDALKEANPNGLYAPSTEALEAAAFKAIVEIVESEADPVSWLLALNVWHSVILSNESAFRQTMKREIDAGTLEGIKMVTTKVAKAKAYMGE
jgi:hypothetical protein